MGFVYEIQNGITEFFVKLIMNNSVWLSSINISNINQAPYYVWSVESMSIVNK